jgi:hypothetical protein
VAVVGGAGYILSRNSTSILSQIGASLPTSTATSEATDDLLGGEPEITPEAGTSRVKLGEAQRISCDGENCMDVTVVKRTFACELPRSRRLLP